MDPNDVKGLIGFILKERDEKISVILKENAHLRAEITELRARVINGQAIDTDRS